MIPAGILASAHVSASGPASITGLHTWYDAADASTFTFGTGTKVSQWRDKSGNARHLNQATAGNQPDRSGSINGVTAVQFSSGSSTRMDTSAFTLAQPFTTIVVIDGGPTSTLNFGLLGSVGGTFGGLYAGAGVITLYAGSNSIGPYGHAGKHVWYGFFSNGTAATTGFGMDGGTRALGYAPGTAGTTTGWRVGAEKSLTGGYFFSGPIGEALVYDHVLTSGEYTTIAAYLRTKWGTP